MRASKFAASLLALSVSLCGCAATTTTSKVATDYNQIFAQSRDEVLVTNILRASAREPLLFSTMGTVSGGVRNSGSIMVPFTNLIGGALTAISPQVTVNDGINPAIQIVPLSSKEFTDGILTPVKLKTIEAFEEQGWDSELLLSLLVGGVVCPDGSSVLNRGYPGAEFDRFAAMFQAVGQKPLVASGNDQPYVTVIMPATEALALAKDGAGEGRKVGSVKDIEKNGKPSGTVEVSIVKTAEPTLVKLDTSGVCAEHSKKPADAPENWQPAEPVVLLRSVEALIYFLGETQRYRDAIAADCLAGANTPRWPYYRRTREYPTPDGQMRMVTENLSFFHVQRLCGGGTAPSGSFVHARFNGADYFIRRAEDAPPDDQPHCTGTDAAPYCDRTLATVALLDELIALQMSGSTIESSKPIVTIPVQ